MQSAPIIEFEAQVTHIADESEIVFVPINFVKGGAFPHHAENDKERYGEEAEFKKWSHAKKCRKSLSPSFLCVLSSHFVFSAWSSLLL